MTLTRMRYVGALWLVACLVQFALISGVRAADAQEFFDPSLGELNVELRHAMAAGKSALMIMFGSEKCPYCRRMRATVFRDAEVVDYFNRHFAKVEVDVLGAVDIIDFSGNVSTEKAFATRLGIVATPTFVFFDGEGHSVMRYSGALERREFLLMGRFVAEGHYMRERFDDFRKRVN